MEDRKVEIEDYYNNVSIYIKREEFIRTMVYYFYDKNKSLIENIEYLEYNVLDYAIDDDTIEFINKFMRKVENNGLSDIDNYKQYISDYNFNDLSSDSQECFLEEFKDDLEDEYNRTHNY